MEKGFYHPDRGYWQTTNEPSEAILSTYPEGTVEVPLKPSGLHTFNGTDWVPPTQAAVDEAKATEVRQERDVLLMQSDWMASQDRTMTQAQIDYRQALRDITDQAGFPTNVTWPTKPE